MEPHDDMFVQELCGGVCVRCLASFSIGPFNGIVRRCNDVPIEVGGWTNWPDEIYTPLLEGLPSYDRV